MLGATIRNVTMVVGLMVVAAFGLNEYSGLMDAGKRTASGNTPVRAAAARKEPPPRQRASSNGTSMAIAPGPGGHYYVDAEINGYGIGMMIDTGATVVALSSAAAERIGLSVHHLEFNHVVNTANGVARVAPVMLDEVTIGEITVRDVEAVVLERPMGMSLLGMSFLKRLAGFSIERGELVLRR